MKNVKAMFAAMILGLMLSGATLAGDVSTPGYVPPPPPPTAASLQEDETTAPGDISSPGFATILLIAALDAFYQQITDYRTLPYSISAASDAVQVVHFKDLPELSQMLDKEALARES